MQRTIFLKLQFCEGIIFNLYWQRFWVQNAAVCFKTKFSQLTVQQQELYKWHKRAIDINMVLFVMYPVCFLYVYFNFLIESLKREKISTQSRQSCKGNTNKI